MKSKPSIRPWTELGVYYDISAPPPSSRTKVKKKLESLDADVIFNLFEGFDGCPETEGKVARMLAESEIPFTGCPASSSGPGSG